MHSSLVALTLLFTTAFSLPQGGPYQQGPGPWYVTKYNPGCGTSPAGCVYSFDICYVPSTSQDPATTEPAFSTTCTGTNIQGGYKACGGDGVSSNEVPSDQDTVLFVQHVYEQGGKTFTMTGNATITDEQTEGQAFEIVPSTITAVA